LASRSALGWRCNSIVVWAVLAHAACYGCGLLRARLDTGRSIQLNGLGLRCYGVAGRAGAANAASGGGGLLHAFLLTRCGLARSALALQYAGVTVGGLPGDAAGSNVVLPNTLIQLRSGLGCTALCLRCHGIVVVAGPAKAARCGGSLLHAFLLPAAVLWRGAGAPTQVLCRRRRFAVLSTLRIASHGSHACRGQAGAGNWLSIWHLASAPSIESKVIEMTAR
jgi:hypothetical protein